MKPLDAKIVQELKALGCLNTSEVYEEVAWDFEVSRSTVRRHLDRLEAEGLVEGFMHDERDLLPNGRERIYWNLTERAKA